MPIVTLQTFLGLLKLIQFTILQLLVKRLLNDQGMPKNITILPKTSKKSFVYEYYTRFKINQVVMCQTYRRAESWGFGDKRRMACETGHGKAVRVDVLLCQASQTLHVFQGIWIYLDRDELVRNSKLPGTRFKLHYRELYSIAVRL